MADTRPNVLWFSLEDTSPRFGCYGDDLARTPNLDHFADEGIRYPNACSTAGVCAPSRNAVITGCYQTHTGGHHMRTRHTNQDAPDLPTPYENVPPHYVRAFTEFLRAEGYYCTNNSKTDYQFDVGWKAPVTAWDECHDEAHWRNRPGDDQPFFSVFNPTRTHESGQWPDSDTGRDGAPETDPDVVEVPEYLPDTEGVRKQIARQYDNVARSDEQLGELLAQLEADGELANTYVFIWSDHGEGLPRAKRSLYDSGINVPLLVAGPGLAEGDVRGAPVSLVDLAPTVLELTGVEGPAYFDGQPFLGREASSGSSDAASEAGSSPRATDVVEREYAFAARDRMDESYDMARAVRTERFKYVRNYYPENPRLQWIPYRAQGPAMRDLLERYREDELSGPPADLFGRRPAEELYDLGEDPAEVDNLADDPDYRDVLVELRERLDEWRDRYDPLGDEPEREMVERMHPDRETRAVETGGEGVRETAPPVFVPNTAENPTREAVDGGELDGPALLQLECSTQGASIAYAIDDDPREADGHHEGWDLYTEPIRLSNGETTVYARAVRYGYEESEVRTATFDVSK
jgi:arylsulfatase A-like enzyme